MKIYTNLVEGGGLYAALQIICSEGQTPLEAVFWGLAQVSPGCEINNFYLVKQFSGTSWFFHFVLAKMFFKSKCKQIRTLSRSK